MILGGGDGREEGGASGGCGDDGGGISGDEGGGKIERWMEEVWVIGGAKVAGRSWWPPWLTDDVGMATMGRWRKWGAAGCLGRGRREGKWKRVKMKVLI